MTCTKCKQKFSYKDILKAIMCYKLICKNCKKKYKVPALYRLTISILFALPVFFQIYLINIFSYYVIIMYLAYCIVVVLISSLFVKFIEEQS